MLRNSLFGALCCLFVFQLNAQNITQPTPLSPADLSTVTDPYPIFTWLPAYPLINEQAVYELKIVQMVGTQSAYAAIQANPSWYSSGSLAVTTHQYPVFAQHFAAGFSYAWNVKATITSPDHAPLVLESEVWQFSVPDSVPSIQSPTTQPVIHIGTLKKDLDAGYYSTVNKKVYFKFLEEYKPDSAMLTFKIYNWQRENITTNQALALTYGQNWYLLDFQSISNVSAGKYYILEVTNAKKEVYFLRFKMD